MLACIAESLGHRLRTALAGLAWVGWIIVASGCGNQPADENETPKQNVQATVTDEDFAKLRNAIESAAEDRDRSRFISLFSKRAMFNLVFADIKLANASRRKIESRINRGGNLAFLANRIFSGLQDNGQFDFVRRIDKEDVTSMLFRFVVPKRKEVAYFRFDIGMGSKSRFRFQDVYFYLEQESLVQQLRQQVLMELKSANELESESGKDLSAEIAENHSDTDEFRKLLELVSSEKWQEAWIAYDHLPVQVRQSRRAIVQKLLIAERLGAIYFDTAIKETRELIAESIRIEFIAFNYFRKNQDDRHAIDSVDRLIEIMQDPFLKRMKINPLIRIGEKDLARKIVDEIQSTEGSDSSQILLFRFELANADKDFATCIKYLTKLRMDHGVTVENLDELPRYAELIKSREYSEWKANSI